MQITDYILQEFKHFKFCAVYQQRMSGRQALPVLETIDSVLEECAGYLQRNFTNASSFRDLKMLFLPATVYSGT